MLKSGLQKFEESEAIRKARKETRISDTYNSMIEISLEEFKYFSLMNAGAIVAILSNLQAFNKDEQLLPIALLAFTTGVVTGGLSLCFSYATQYALLHDLEQERDVEQHGRFMACTAILLFITIIAFIFGVLFAYKSYTV